MTRWLDKPSMDSDEAIDHVIERSRLFLQRYFSPIAKVATPLLGFAIFLSYFHQHHFYPSFDLFQFSSLLLAACMIGVFIVGSSVALLLIAGAWMHYGFTNAPAIKQELAYIRPQDNRQRTHFALKLIGLVYVLPLTTTAMAITYALVSHTTLFATVFFIAPVAATLLAGLLIQQQFELRSFSFLRFIWAAYVPVLLIALLSALTLRDVAPYIDGLADHEFRTLSLYAIACLISLIASFCTVSFIGGWSFALHFCGFFGLAIAFYSGLVTQLPDKVVQGLGLGNYSAATITLADDYCEGSTRQALSLGENCSLRDVHVVWLMGETLTYKTSQDSDELIQIPTRFIKAVIRPAN